MRPAPGEAGLPRTSTHRGSRETRGAPDALAARAAPRYVAALFNRAGALPMARRPFPNPETPMLTSLAPFARRAALLLALAAPALAADVYVVHGIPGADLGLDPALAVDVDADGAPALSGFEFGDVAGPIDLPTGEHTFEVRLAGVATVVATARLQFGLNETAVIVANRDANGTIQLSKFTVDTSGQGEGQARLAVAHAARLAPVDVTAKGTDGTKGSAKIKALPNGSSSLPANVAAGTWKFTIKAAGVKGNVAVLDDVAIAGNVLLVAVGSLEAETFTVIPVAIATNG